MENTTKKRITQYIENYLSEKRKRHTYAVALEAATLASLYNVDPEKAELAALFHDMFRGKSQETLDDYVRKLNLDPYYLGNANLSHGKIAAIIMKQDYNIEDQDMINAVAFHTTGRAKMSHLEKIIYLADVIEPNRKYPGIMTIKKTAYKNLDQACLMAFEHSINYIKNNGNHLDPDTIKARNYLVK